MALSEILKMYDIQNGDLKYLQLQIDNEWIYGHPSECICDIVQFLDRLGDSELFGVAWSLLHGLESLPNYEREVIRDWKPTTWRKRLIKRMINAKITEVDGVKLEMLLA